jgi:RNA polymerase sigma factor (sigma-70 family)
MREITPSAPPPRDARAGEDEVLLERVAAGDRSAFETLYGLYYRRLFGYLLKVTRRADLVEEVLNDVMLVVWRKAGSFNGRSRPSTWIFGIAYHKALKALAHRRTAASLTVPENEDDDRHEPIEPDEPESLAARRELATVLGRALHRLSAEHRAVVELTYYYGCSYQEIADIVDCPVNTVKTRMFHARRKLKSLLPSLGISSHTG